MREVRKATLKDLSSLVELLHDDDLGKDRENAITVEKYENVFTELCGSPYFEVYVMEEEKKSLAVTK